MHRLAAGPGFLALIDTRAEEQSLLVLACHIHTQTYNILWLLWELGMQCSSSKCLCTAYLIRLKPVWITSRGLNTSVGQVKKGPICLDRRIWAPNIVCHPKRLAHLIRLYLQGT